MVRINFSEPNQENPFGVVKAEVFSNSISVDLPWKKPLKFRVTGKIDKKVKWDNELWEGTWSCFFEPCNTISEVLDQEGNVITKWEWDTFSHGDEAHSLFMLWCLNNKGAKGIAIGTHDGTTGEWVEPLVQGLVEAFLVEASVPQYKDLVRNYKNVNGCFPILSLITKDGEDCEFFESPEGFTNSVIMEHTQNYSSEVTRTFKKSKSLNDLICEVGLSKEIKWLHLDVEGIDGDLVTSLDDSRINLPEFIIYESLNLSDEKKKEVFSWLSQKGYFYKESGWNTIAYKKYEK